MNLCRDVVQFIARRLSMDLSDERTTKGLRGFSRVLCPHSDLHPGARSVLILPESEHILVLSTLDSRIVAIVETPGDNETTIIEQFIIVSGSEWGLPSETLNHGLAYASGHIYASSIDTVYRWPYTPGSLETVTVPPTRVVVNIPDNGHWTRTIIFDSEELLYVAVGSEEFFEVDQDSERARIRRFNISRVPIQGMDFEEGEVFADGLRNEVGLALDSAGVLWGVENSAQVLDRPDLGQNISYGNPAEELNAFPVFGVHYGYPYCWSSDELEGYGKGEQFLWPTFLNDGVHSDEWCRNLSNNQPPALILPAHSAPLGLEFYDGVHCNNPGSFPCSALGNVVIAFHGSQPEYTLPPEYSGYKVSIYDVTTGAEEVIIQERNKGCIGQEGCFRPVNAVFDWEGRLIVSDDESGVIVRVTYDG